MKNIKTEAGYNNVMAKIDSLMAKGNEGVSKEELAKIRALALSAQAHEQLKYFFMLENQTIKPSSLRTIVKQSLHRKVTERNLFCPQPL